MKPAPLKVVIKHLFDLGYNVTHKQYLSDTEKVTFKRVREGELTFDILNGDGNVVGEATRD